MQLLIQCKETLIISIEASYLQIASLLYMLSSYTSTRVALDPDSTKRQLIVEEHMSIEAVHL